MFFFGLFEEGGVKRRTIHVKRFCQSVVMVVILRLKFFAKHIFFGKYSHFNGKETKTRKKKKVEENKKRKYKNIITNFTKDKHT